MSERSIFLEALDRTDPGERNAYLDEACQGNVQLRQQVESLLRHHAGGGSFLEKPPQELAATIVTGMHDTVDEEVGEITLDFLAPCEKPDRIGKLGPYEVIEVVGRGGMGVVVRAHDVKLDRVVAIKILAPELAANAMAVKRFLREALAAAAVTHDHVVNIHAINDEHRPPFLVMEFVDGLSLQEKIDRSGALELREILRIGMQTASGLAAAHKQGLVHRDIKPANILLENGVERVKITDFGLARAVDDVNITRTGMIAGTPQYMSPEQAQGQVIDHRSDLFALGSVLYAMCTGRPAFRADNAMAVMNRVCQEAPRPIREINPEIPAWLEAIIDRLLSKDAGDRFQSADEVAELLSEWLAHVNQPALIPPPVASPAPKTKRTTGQRPRSTFHTAHRGRWFTRTSHYVIAACLLVGLFALAAVLFLRTNNGTLVIKTDGLGDVQLVVKQGERKIRVIDTEDGRDDVTTRLSVGEYEIEIVGDRPELKLTRDHVLIHRGGEYVVEITHVPLDGRPAGGIFGQRQPKAAPLPQEVEKLVRHIFSGWGGALSPDGSKLVRQTGRVGANPNGHLELVDLESGKRMRLLAGGKDPAWSPLPDGPIATVLHNGGDETIWLIEPDSGKARKLAPGGFPSWSADGQTLFYLHQPSGEVRALAVNVEGAKPRVLWTKPGNLYPAVSPTGRHMAVFNSGHFLVKDLESRQTIADVDAKNWGGTLAGWSPDGRYVAFGSYGVGDNRGLWLLDIQDKQAVQLLSGSFTLPRWSADGKRMVFDHRPGQRVCVVDVEELLALGKTPADAAIKPPLKLLGRFEGHTSNVKAVAVSPDGNLAASASGYPRGDQSLRLWDIATRKQIRRFDGHTNQVLSVAFSPDGKRLLSGSADGTARLWDIEDGKELQKFEGHELWVNGVAFMPDGTQVITSCAKAGAVRIWDVETGQEIRKLTQPVSGQLAIAISPDGKRLLSGSNNTARIWDVQSGTLLRILDGHAAQIEDATFSSDGRLALTCALDGTIRLWDVDAGKETGRFAGHTGGVVSVTFAEGDRRIVSGGYDGSVRMWNVASQREVARVQKEEYWFQSVRVVPKSQLVLTGGGDRSRVAGRPVRIDPMHLWELPQDVPEELEEIGEIRRFRGHQFGVRGDPVVSPDGSLIAAMGEGVRIWDVESGQQRTHLPVEDESSVIFLTQDPRLVAIGTIDGDILIWNMQLNREQRRLSAHGGEVHSLALSPDGKTLAAASFRKGDGDAKLWNLETYESDTLIVEPTHTILFTPDGKRVITATEGDRGTLRVWDTDMGSEIFQMTDIMREGHHVEAIAVSPDGGHLAVGGGNWRTGSGELVLIDLEQRNVIHRRADSISDFRSVTFSPDGRLLAVGAGLGRVVLFNARTWQELTTFTAYHWHDGPLGRIVSGLHFLPEGESLLVSAEFEDAGLWRLSADALVQNAHRRSETGLSSEIIKSLVSEAAGIPNQEWITLAEDKKGPHEEAVNGTPLSLLLLTLNSMEAAKENADVMKDFWYLTETLPKPTQIADAIWISKAKGYASFIQPEYITQVTGRTNDQTAQGYVAFAVPKLYTGRVNYTARRSAEGWRIEEFHLPHYGIAIRRQNEGRWESVVDDSR